MIFATHWHKSVTKILNSVLSNKSAQKGGSVSILGQIAGKSFDKRQKVIQKKHAKFMSEESIEN